ncbi:MAG TPA: hypothetical protein VIG88_11105 [Lysobacter sp.]
MTTIRSLLPLSLVLAFPAATLAAQTVTIRTEQYPRPPYSGATYFIYEKGGETICTKLEVCNKFGECRSTYHRGAHKDPEDRETGKPYGTTPAVVIAPAKAGKHVCLVRHGTGSGRR